MNLRLLATAMFCCISSIALAQQANGKGSDPEWVKMIDNPSANYFVAVKSFDAYWKGREKPVDEVEILNEEITSREKREVRRTERKLRKMTAAERQQFDYLAYQYKRFLNWQHEIRPYVQDNGSILSQDDRNKMWEQQQNEAKNR